MTNDKGEHMSETRGLLLAWSSPATAAITDEFNRWQDETHVPQVREALGTVLSVRRFLHSAEGELPRYLSVYELSTAEVDEAYDLLRAAVADGRVERSELMHTGECRGRAEWYRLV